MLKNSYFLSQPHQPYFLLGVVNAVVMMLLFALSYKGVFSLEMISANLHVYSIAFLVFANLFNGFLFTTFPRFNQSGVIEKSFYSNLFYATLFAEAIFIAGLFLSHILLVVGMAMLYATQLLSVKKLQTIYSSGRVAEKSDSFWIMIAEYFGLLGHLLFVVIELQNYTTLEFSLFNFATYITFYLYLIFLAFSVGQRMIPFFSHSFAPKNPNFVKVVFVLFLLKTLFASLEIKSAEIVVDILLGGYTLYEFNRWKLPLFNSPAILWVLHLSLFWIPVAFLLSALSLTAELLLDNSFYFLNIHLLAIGFLTTVLIGFGTRVTLGHSGQAPQADRFVTNLFWFVQVVVVMRLLFSLNIAFEWGAEFLFDISFTTWIILFMLWINRYAKVLLFRKKS
jgi:uncharacterized protein involved in response to NO